MLNIQTHTLTHFVFRIHVNVFYFFDSPPSPPQCDQNAEHSKAKIDIGYVQNICKQIFVFWSFFHSFPPPPPPRNRMLSIQKHKLTWITFNTAFLCVSPPPSNNTVYRSVLKCLAFCCNALLRIAMCCSVFRVLQGAAVWHWHGLRSTMLSPPPPPPPNITVWYCLLQCFAVWHWHRLQSNTIFCCSVLQCGLQCHAVWVAVFCRVT